MNDSEKSRYPQLRELFLAKIKIAFIADKKTRITKLSLDQLQKIFIGDINNWKEVGGLDMPIMLLGREKGEALFSVLCKDYPFFVESDFVKIFKKDNQMIKGLATVPGSIGFGAKPNFDNNDKYNILEVKEFSSGVDIGLVYDVKNENAPVIKAVKNFVATDIWLKIIKENDLLPTL